MRRHGQRRSQAGARARGGRTVHPPGQRAGHVAACGRVRARPDQRPVDRHRRTGGAVPAREPVEVAAQDLHARARRGRSRDPGSRAGLPRPRADEGR